MNEPRKPQNEEQLDALVRELASGYHEPPRELDEQSRERIFTGIQRARQRRRRTPAPRPLRRWLQVAGFAAVLAIGIAIGRVGAPGPDAVDATDPVAVSEPGDDARRSVYRFAARAYLERTENLLLMIERAAYSPDASTPWRTGTAEPTVGWARDLLRESRLLQDSPATKDDPELARLLEDLELLLAQIVQAASGHEELEGSLLGDPTVLQRVRGEIERAPVLEEI